MEINILLYLHSLGAGAAVDDERLYLKITPSNNWDERREVDKSVLRLHEDGAISCSVSQDRKPTATSLQTYCYTVRLCNSRS